MDACSGARVTQKLRIQFLANAAISHRRRVARPGARRDPRRHSRRALRSTSTRSRATCAAARAATAAAGAWRSSPIARRSSRAFAPGETHRRPDRDADREPRLGELAAHDARRRDEPPPDAGGARRAPVTRPRPGHADLAGVAKYGRADMRDVLERASARETAARVAAGAIARQLLAHVGVRIASHVFAIGSASACRITRRDVRRRPRRCPTTRRCAASTPASSSR